MADDTLGLLPRLRENWRAREPWERHLVSWPVACGPLLSVVLFGMPNQLRIGYGAGWSALYAIWVVLLLLPRRPVPASSIVFLATLWAIGAVTGTAFIVGTFL